MPLRTVDQNWQREMELRIKGVEDLSELLKDELSGLRLSIRSLLTADKEKTNALEGHHQAYAAASLRAEAAETRAARAERRVEALEADLHRLRGPPVPPEND